MEKWLYVMMIKKGKTYNKVTKAVITRHVENLRNLDAEGKIELCGPFKGYPGVAGMVVFKTESYEEAEALCKQEPLVAEGFATYTLAALQVAEKAPPSSPRIRFDKCGKTQEPSTPPASFHYSR